MGTAVLHSCPHALGSLLFLCDLLLATYLNTRDLQRLETPHLC